MLVVTCGQYVPLAPQGCIEAETEALRHGGARPAVLLTHGMTLGKSPHFLEPWFPFPHIMWGKSSASLQALARTQKAPGTQPALVTSITWLHGPQSGYLGVVC